MAISTKAELAAAVQEWNVNRSDLPFDNLIALAELRLKRDVRPPEETEGPLVGVVDTREIDLPDDFSEPRALFIELDPGRKRVEFVSRLFDTTTGSCEPRYWSIQGDQVVFPQPVDQAYDFTLLYQPKYVLVADGDTNDLLTEAPDLYLWATNLEAALWLKDDKQINRALSAYDRNKADFNTWAGRRKSQAKLRGDPALVSGHYRRSGYDIRTDQ